MWTGLKHMLPQRGVRQRRLMLPNACHHEQAQGQQPGKLSSVSHLRTPFMPSNMSALQARQHPDTTDSHISLASIQTKENVTPSLWMHVYMYVCMIVPGTNFGQWAGSSPGPQGCFESCDSGSREPDDMHAARCTVYACAACIGLQARQLHLAACHDCMEEVSSSLSATSTRAGDGSSSGSCRGAAGGDPPEELSSPAGAVTPTGCART